MFEGVWMKENSMNHAFDSEDWGRYLFLLGGGLVLLMDLDKYNLTYAVPAQACRERQGERAEGSSARLLWIEPDVERSSTG